MTYFTDKAFSSTFLNRSRGLQEMIVKKEEDLSPSLDSDLKHKHEELGYKRFSSTKQEKTSKDYLDDYNSSRPRQSRQSSSSIVSTNSTNERNPHRLEERTSARPQPGGRQRVSLAGRERSHYSPPGSGDESYGTILIKARSDGGEASLPVSMMVTTTTNRQPDDDRKSSQPVAGDRCPPTKKNEVEYHSDKYFTNYFLNSNPKLEEMLTKVESQ